MPFFDHFDEYFTDRNGFYSKPQGVLHGSEFRPISKAKKMLQTIRDLLVYMVLRMQKLVRFWGGKDELYS